MSKIPPASPPTPTPAPDQPAAWQQLLRQHAAHIAGALILLLLVILIPLLTAAYRRQAAAQSFEMLSVAQTPAQWEEILNNHAGTPAAPLAALALAGFHYHAGNFTEAEEVYLGFQQDFPRHAMLPAARLGLTMCREARGEEALAMEGFRDFIEMYPDHFLTPQALFGQARCLARQGDKDAARIIYEDYLVAHPEGAWSSQAEMALNLLRQEASVARTAPQN
ncbi:MAG: tol-pal system YbgF family protein [Kiritimatiellia bacterium]